ncbi:hypothetical protein MRX96_029834 [Rhipicephalus microplus]
MLSRPHSLHFQRPFTPVRPPYTSSVNREFRREQCDSVDGALLLLCRRPEGHKRERQRYQYPRGSDGDCVYTGRRATSSCGPTVAAHTMKDSNTMQPGGATTSTTTANETSPMPAGMADPTPAGSPPSSQPEAPPPLRRSNRLRRPPQRFNW